MLTIDQIRAMSPDQRFNLYQNAKRKGADDAEATRIIGLMVDHDLLVTDSGGLPNEHPVILEIEAVVRSTRAGRQSRRQPMSACPRSQVWTV